MEELEKRDIKIVLKWTIRRGNQWYESKDVRQLKEKIEFLRRRKNSSWKAYGKTEKNPDKEYNNQIYYDQKIIW